MPKIQRSEPAYTQVAAHLRQQIVSGQLKEGEQIPPATELEQQFDVSVWTAHRAVQTLASEGLVKIVQRQGAFVQPHAMWQLTTAGRKEKTPEEE